MYLRSLFLLALLSFTLHIPSYTEQIPKTAQEGTLDSLANVLSSTIATLTTPELEERKARRQEMQRREYAHVLHHARKSDAVSTLLAWLRMKLQLEFSLPSSTVYYYARTVRGGYMPFPLTEDRSIPSDPWERK